MKLENYSGTIEETSTKDVVIKSRPDLDAMIADASPARRLLRATGNSIHDQALTSATAVFLRGLPHAIVVTPSDVISKNAAGADVKWATVRVSAWTPWEAVMRAVLRVSAKPQLWNGTWDLDAAGTVDPASPDTCAWAEAHGDRRFVPYVVPSSGRITVGGSLAADTMWRFSTMFGHQARSVVWVDLLAYDKDAQGKRVPHVLRLLNPDGGMWAHRSTLHQDPSPHAAVRFAEQADGGSATNDLYFRGVIGSFGTLGPILQAKLMLMEIGDTKSTEFDVLPFPDTTPPPPPFPSPPSAPPSTPPPPSSPTAPHERLAPPIDRLHNPIDPPGHPDETLRRQMRGEIPFVDVVPFAAITPNYPHASANELGSVGSDAPQKAITWMWVTDDPEAVFDDLLSHHKKHAQKPLEDGFALPRKVGKDGWTRFGLFFPGRTDALVTAVGSVAFGRPPGSPKEFKMWNRSYSRDNLGLVLKALPWAAGLGEDIAYHAIFKDTMADTAAGKVRANPIAEFALFMEGHSAKIAPMKDKPQTVQQTFVFPLPADVSTWGDKTKTKDAKAVFVRFLTAVRTISTEAWDPLGGEDGAIRIQICDVKVLPRGTTLLASASDSPCMAITLAIEDGRDLNQLGWGKPSKRLEDLCAQFMNDRVKVHLTKNRHVRTGVIATMYGAQILAFEEVKTALDPDGIYGSMFATDMTI